MIQALLENLVQFWKKLRTKPVAAPSWKLQHVENL
jgi:hypothetical protein